MKLLDNTWKIDVRAFSSTSLNISQQVQLLENSSSFLKMLQIHKQTSKYAVLYLKKLDPEIVGIKKQLQGFLRHIAGETESLVKDRMQFNLTFFSYTLKLYKKKFATFHANSKIVENKRRRNQKDKFFQTHAQDHLEYQKSNNDINIDEYILKVINNSVSLQNSQCVCCSRVFIKGQVLINRKAELSKVIGLPQAEWNRDNLQKYVCAVCNSGGGVIVIGTENEKRNKIEGIKFKSSKQIEQKEKMIKSLIDTIQPNFEIQKKIVAVLGDKNYNAEQQKKQLYCIVINILPCDKSRKFYIQSKNKGYHNIYQTFQLDQQNKLKKYKNEENRIQNFYYQIVKHYAMKNRENLAAQPHRNIKCDASDNFKQSEEANEDDSLTEPQYEQQLKFKYTYSSLFIVGSKKKDDHIKSLCEYMKEKKSVFEVTKPFSTSFKQGVRSVWLISHSDRHQDIKRYLKQKDKSGTITMVPIFKTLQIQREKLTTEKQMIIQQVFKAKYSASNYKIEEIVQISDGIQKKIVSQVFNCFAHAIYAYMIFESLQLRPYFVKNNTTYKKKAKTTVVQ